jgi:hypothetical protein
MTTAFDHITAVQQHIRNHGPELPCLLRDPETGTLCPVTVELRCLDGVYLELVPVRTAQPVQG